MSTKSVQNRQVLERVLEVHDRAARSLMREATRHLREGVTIARQLALLEHRRPRA